MTAVGDRVMLIRCDDEWTHLRPGALGTVTFIDSVGTVFVDWDEGGKLGLVVEAGDAWAVVSS